MQPEQISTPGQVRLGVQPRASDHENTSFPRNGIILQRGSATAWQSWASRQRSRLLLPLPKDLTRTQQIFTQHLLSAKISVRC